MIESGQSVAWEYQSSGKSFSRFGVVLRDIPKGESVKEFLTKEGFVFNPNEVADTSTYHRYLISVGEGDDVEFFTPLVSIVDKSNVNLANLGKLKAAQQKAKLDAENLQAEINKTNAILRAEAMKEEAGKVSAIAGNMVKDCEINKVKLYKVLEYVQSHYAEMLDPKVSNVAASTTKGLLTYNGQTASIKEWAKIKGIHYATLVARINSGWSVEAVLNKPVRQVTK